MRQCRPIPKSKWELPLDLDFPRTGLDLAEAGPLLIPSQSWVKEPVWTDSCEEEGREGGGEGGEEGRRGEEGREERKKQ